MISARWGLTRQLPQCLANAGSLLVLENQIAMRPGLVRFERSRAIVGHVNASRRRKFKVMIVRPNRIQNARQIPGRPTLRRRRMKFVCLQQWVMRDVTEISLDAVPRKLYGQPDFKAAEYNRRQPVRDNGLRR